MLRTWGAPAPSTVANASTPTYCSFFKHACKSISSSSFCQNRSTRPGLAGLGRGVRAPLARIAEQQLHHRVVRRRNPPALQRLLAKGVCERRPPLADVARADPQRVGGQHHVLRGRRAVLCREEEVLRRKERHDRGRAVERVRNARVVRDAGLLAGDEARLCRHVRVRIRALDAPQPLVDRPVLAHGEEDALAPARAGRPEPRLQDLPQRRLVDLLRRKPPDRAAMPNRLQDVCHPHSTSFQHCGSGA